MEILEGGNVFKNRHGMPATGRIDRENVVPTIQWLEQLTGLSLAKNMLGTTGRAETSGDLDVAIDVSKISKDDFKKILLSKGVKSDDIKLSGDNVHYKTPILGDPANGYVQTDFMFGEPKWQNFFFSGAPEGSRFKGAHRNILMASIAKFFNMKWSPKLGLVDRATDKVISKNPDKIANILFHGKASDLGSVESILNKIRDLPSYQELVKDAREAFAKQGIQLELTEYDFISRMRDRIVNQGMQVIVEAARIEHPEDLIFAEGSRGALRAISMLKNLPKTAENITIKWDGKPAIIFGRNEKGEFVLTDKSGFIAKGYQGKARSSQELAKIMKARGGDRKDLISMYKKLWAPLEAQTPQELRGYIHGDLLYVDQPKNIKGNWVFQPNTVTYSIPGDTSLGKKIENSVAGVVIHTFKKDSGDSGTPFTDVSVLKDGPVLILGPKLQEKPTIKIPTKDLDAIEKIIAKNSGLIDKLLNPATLRELKLTNLAELMKQFGNAKVRQGNFDNMADEFISWVEAKVSEPKLIRISQFLEENIQGLATVFMLYNSIQLIKTRMVRQLDQATGGSIQAHIADEPGHEGYVTHDSGISHKLVDRLRFSKQNFARNNPEL